MQTLDSIHVTTHSEAVRARRKLCRTIFGTPHVPRELPAPLHNQPSPLAGLPTCSCLVLPDCADVYRYVPDGWNGRLLFVHQGHWNDFESGGVGDMVRAAFNAGCAVATCLMPADGSSVAHDTGTIPLATFLRPIHAAINHCFATLPNLKKVCMTGVSGGAWATIMACALDSRILRGVSRSGWMPLYLNPPTGGTGRDWEQLWLANTGYSYLDLAIAASLPARRHVQIMADDQTCSSSWLTTGPDYVSEVQQHAPNFSRVHIPTSLHEYTPADIATVMTEVMT